MSIRDRIISLERVKARDLRPHPLNPRVHPPGQSAQVKLLLDEIGMADRLLAYRDMEGKLRLVDGHLRRELAGDQEVPVLVTDLNEEEAAMLLAVGDPLAGLAQVDHRVMEELLQQTDSDLLAELLAAGDGLAELLGREAPEVGGGLLPGVDPDAIPEDAETRCQPGDLWGLGDHRLVVGDCTDTTTVARLMAGERAKLLLTDPPYAVDYVEKARDMNRRGYVHSRATLGAAIEGDGIEAGQEEALWRGAFLMAYAEAIEEAAGIYVWFADQRTTAIHVLMESLGILHHQHLVWSKPNFVIGRCDYQWKHELCFYGWKQGRRPPFYGSKNQTTVWDVARDTQKPLHPTQKPVAIFEPPVMNHLKPSEALYDPFAGSGTAIIAAEAHGRRAFACEVSPKHADTCLARWELATGREAVRLEAG